MKYIEVKISVPEIFTEILIAELLNDGYDSFEETNVGLNAYIEAEKFNEVTLTQILAKYRSSFNGNYTFAPLGNINWNEEWEKNYDPVIIDNRCIIRASFHVPDKPYLLDIVINPKMSFGTGHHETTSMMVEHLLNMISLEGKNVMDAGCGTGILSIVAAKIGASSVTAFDIEEWAFENSKENLQQNHIDNVYVSIDTVATVSHTSNRYDIILANINKNVLLSEIPLYNERLNNKGLLLLSGFYENDVQDIEAIADKCYLKRNIKNTKNNWASLVYEKDST